MSMSKIVNKIIAFESEELSAEETLELFSELVKSEQIWTLQGHYGRTAQDFIDNGFLDRNGNILRHFSENEG